MRIGRIVLVLALLATPAIANVSSANAVTYGICDGHLTPVIPTTGGPINVYMGTPGPDYILGTSGNDFINGGGGNDHICGGGGDDAIIGGEGDDVIHGGAGNDIILGGDGNDTISGGTGDDTIDGGPGHNTVTYAYATVGIHTSYTLGGNFPPFGIAVPRVLNVRAGSDDHDILDPNSVQTIIGSPEQDSIFVGNSPAWINAGNITIHGGGGDDSLALPQPSNLLGIAIQGQVAKNMYGDAGVDSCYASDPIADPINWTSNNIQLKTLHRLYQSCTDG
jgi:Ca2+-binding RTX toxin-like protein